MGAGFYEAQWNNRFEQVLYGGSDTFHGCDLRLSVWSGVVKHESKSSGLSTPTIRSYRDGIKVGCTFLTNDAVEQLYRWHKSFLTDQDSKTHQ